MNFENGYIDINQLNIVSSCSFKPNPFIFILGEQNNYRTSIILQIINSLPKYDEYIIVSDSNNYDYNFTHVNDLNNPSFKYIDIENYCAQSAELNKDTNKFVLIDQYNKKSPSDLYFTVNSRHYKATIIVVSDSPTILSPEIRSSIDYFIMTDYNNTLTKKIYDYYCGFLPSLTLLKKILNFMKENNYIFVVNNNYFSHNNIYDRFGIIKPLLTQNENETIIPSVLLNDS